MISKTVIKERANKKGNPELKKIVTLLRKKNQFWLDVAKQLVKPRRKKVEVSLEKLEKITKEGEVVLIPGKVLGTGELKHKLTIGAFAISEKALSKLKSSKVLSITQIIENYKDSKEVKVII